MNSVNGYNQQLAPSSFGAIASNAVASERQLEVSDQLSRLDRNLRDVSDRFAELENRLDLTVCRPQPPQSTGDGGVRPVLQSKAGQHLDEFNVAVVSLRARMESVLARLEV